jgi:hypothetical protein
LSSGKVTADGLYWENNERRVCRESCT